MPSIRVWYCECETVNGAARGRCCHCGTSRPENSTILRVDVDELLGVRRVSAAGFVPAVALDDQPSDPKPRGRLSSLLTRVMVR